MAGKRLDSIDITKGIAIISIIVGHMGFRASSDMSTDNWVFQYHVPIFFVISGYFLSTKYPVREFVRDKAFRLLVPYAITAGILVVGCAIICAATGGHWPMALTDPLNALKAAL